MEKMNDKEKKKERNIGMETSEAKQMITLKNLPSNLVEEAIVVLKTNQKVKNLEYMKKKAKEIEQNKEPEDFYLIKEAEMVVNEYIRKLEKNDGNLFYQKAKLEKKCTRMRNLNIGLAICLILSFVLHFFS